MIDININEANELLQKKYPYEIVAFALNYSKNAVLTTNFRPFEGAIIHCVTQVKKDIPIIWCDSGYNTSETYLVADKLINQYELNIDIFLPKRSRAHREALETVPEIYEARHEAFTRELKLEPFERAMNKYEPEIWFTNLRYGQTDHRDNLDILSFSKDGKLKVAPFYYYSDEMMEEYMKTNKIPDNSNYFDLTKGPEHRECGLHT